MTTVDNHHPTQISAAVLISIAGLSIGQATAVFGQDFGVAITPQSQFTASPELPFGMNAQGVGTYLENSGGRLFVPAPNGMFAIEAEPPIIGLEDTYRMSRDQFVTKFADGEFDSEAYSALMEQIEFSGIMTGLQEAEEAASLDSGFIELTALVPTLQYDQETDTFNMPDGLGINPNAFLEALPDQIESLSAEENQEFRDLFSRRDQWSDEDQYRFQELLDKGVTVVFVPPPTEPPPILRRRPSGSVPSISTRTFPYECPDRVPAKTLPELCGILPTLLTVSETDAKSKICSCE